ncbi:MAG: hypothetical protein PHU91_00970 [Candidatus Omnitrophica bacterium]|nr:hypothetical protein [Candidatus Omnitrophota bacterium]MDD5236231.1 hypothetical protein [Candidatus Omnitrophota bacterium]MDD5611113.1 hypothetical protein [Candidatus Omnitrophota bacterium]
MKNIKLFILAVFTVSAMSVLCFSQEEEPIIKKTVASEAKVQYDEQTEKTIKALQDSLKYTSENLRDPFTLNLPQVTTTRSTQSQALPQLKVEGFIWDSSIPQAIINGKVYSIGDTVEGAKITKIDKTGITVLFNGSTYTIR